METLAPKPYSIHRKNTITHGEGLNPLDERVRVGPEADDEREVQAVDQEDGGRLIRAVRHETWPPKHKSQHPRTETKTKIKTKM